MKIVECVPNFSEGRDRAVIDRIAGAIRAVDGVRLLDVDPGEATNRTVMTMVGEPEAVARAAFDAISTAAELIDMRRHRGAHPRQGATDVCPFVPIGELTMDECVELARGLGRRVGEELRIPVYLYEHAATRPERRSLQDVRADEYEGLEARLARPEWEPDFGPAELNARSGAIAIGARKFLVAYNVNLDTDDVKIAKAVAWRIRDSEGPVRGPDHRLLRDEAGRVIRRRGVFEHCKATGWYIDEYRRAQVTMNLTDWEETPIHDVFDACRLLAGEQGARVTGSEIVGLVPRDALLAAGRHYLGKQGASPGAPAAELVRVAVRSLGLDELAPFDPAVKVVEEAVREPGALADRPLSVFVDDTSAATAVPGGGSVSALAAAQAAALCAMVANLSATARGLEDRRDSMGRHAVRAQTLKEALLRAVDEDSKAYAAVLRASRMPRKTDEQKQARERALAAATVLAAAVPLSVLERTIELLDLSEHLIDAGMASSLSDAGVAAAQAASAADGACYNVLINLPGIADRGEAERLRSRACELCERARRLAADIRSVVMGRLSA